MSIIKKLRAIFPRRTKFQLIFLLIGIIVGALLETLALYIISPFITVLLDNSAITANPVFYFIYKLFRLRSATEFLAFLAFLLAFVYIFRGIYLFLLGRVQFRFMSMQQIRLSGKLLSIILQKPYLFHANHNPADLSRVISGDVGALFGTIGSILALLSDFFMSFFMVAFLFTVSPPMTLIVLFLSLVCAFSYFHFFRHKIRELGDINRLKSIAVGKAVGQSLGGIKELKVLHRENYFIEEFNRSSREFVQSNQRFQVYNSLPRLFIESFCFGGAFILIGTMIGLGTDMQALVPQISVFVLAAFRMLPTISRLTGHVGSIMFNIVGVNSVYSYITAKEEPPNTQVREAHSDMEKSLDIVVQNVTFEYPRSCTPVLKDISLRIPHKQSVAFIGPSGAGKTTLADIILSIYGPSNGFVSYDGYDIHENPEKWVKNVGYIPQQIYLLDDTITNNIAFGISSDEIDQEQIWYALEQAQLKDFVLSLPKGLDTMVGDRGVRLSGGQRQRIGIARALYHNPPILILDEATSSLDNETEAAVMDAINSFQGTKTMIIIAHRLSTVERCDIIYRVQDGKVTREK